MPNGDLIRREDAINSINTMFPKSPASDFSYGVAAGMALSIIAVRKTNPPEEPADHLNRCPICGGRLSEVRKQGGRKWQHCFSCHLERQIFFE